MIWGYDAEGGRFVLGACLGGWMGACGCKGVGVFDFDLKVLCCITHESALMAKDIDALLECCGLPCCWAAYAGASR